MTDKILMPYKGWAKGKRGRTYFKVNEEVADELSFESHPREIGERMWIQRKESDYVLCCDLPVYCGCDYEVYCAANYYCERYIFVVAFKSGIYHLIDGEVDDDNDDDDYKSVWQLLFDKANNSHLPLKRDDDDDDDDIYNARKYDELIKKLRARKKSSYEGRFR